MTYYEDNRDRIWNGFYKLAIDPGPDEDAEILVDAVEYKTLTCWDQAIAALPAK